MKRSLTAIIALVMVACMAVPAFAASVCVGTYDWSIASGSTKWNGKDNGCMFGMSKGDATCTDKTTKTTPTDNAELMKVVRLFPDQEVARMSTITSSQSKNFVAGDDAGYYAVITASNNRGATGSTYIDQDSSIVG